MEEKITITLQEYEEYQQLKKRVKELESKLEEKSSQQVSTEEDDWNKMVAAAYSANDAYDYQKALTKNLENAIYNGASKEEITKLESKVNAATKSFNAYKGQVSRYAKKFIDSNYQKNYISSLNKNIDENNNQIKELETKEELTELKKENQKLKRKLKQAESNLIKYMTNANEYIKKLIDTKTQPTLNKESLSEEQLQKISTATENLQQSRNRFKELTNATTEQIESLNKEIKQERNNLYTTMKKIEKEASKVHPKIETPKPQEQPIIDNHKEGDMKEVIENLPPQPELTAHEIKKVQNMINANLDEQNSKISPAISGEKPLGHENESETVKELLSTQSSGEYIGNLNINKDTESEKKSKKHRIAKIRKPFKKIKEIIKKKIPILTASLIITGITGNILFQASNKINKSFDEKYKVEVINETNNEVVFQTPVEQYYQYTRKK